MIYFIYRLRKKNWKKKLKDGAIRDEERN